MTADTAPPHTVERPRARSGIKGRELAQEGHTSLAPCIQRMVTKLRATLAGHICRGLLVMDRRMGLPIGV